MEWNVDLVKRLRKYVEGKRKYMVYLEGEQVGFIDLTPAEYREEYGLGDFYYGSSGNTDFYQGEGIPLKDYCPEDFQVLELKNEITWWED